MPVLIVNMMNFIVSYLSVGDIVETDGCHSAGPIVVSRVEEVYELVMRDHEISSTADEDTCQATCIDCGPEFAVCNSDIRAIRQIQQLEISVAQPTPPFNLKLVCGQIETADLYIRDISSHHMIDDNIPAATAVYVYFRLSRSTVPVVANQVNA